jgi:hypothetical protein
MKKQPAKSSLAMLAADLGVARAQFGFAQTFRNVSVSPNAELSQVSAGGDSICALGHFGDALF